MTTLPQTGATELTSGQATPETTVNEIGRYLDAGFTRCAIEDRDLAAPPGTCADGARYLIASSPTGAWAGQTGKLAIAVGTNAANGWLFVTFAKEGNRLYVRDEDVEIYHNGTAWGGVPGSSTGLTRTISFFFTTTPLTSEKVLLYVACETITLADDFAGSTCSVGTNPTSSFVLTVKKNGSSVGTITISTAGAATFVTTGTTVGLVSGDRLTVEAPGTPDATVADVAITLKGTL